MFSVIAYHTTMSVFFWELRKIPFLILFSNNHVPKRLRAVQYALEWNKMFMSGLNPFLQSVLTVGRHGCTGWCSSYTGRRTLSFCTPASRIVSVTQDRPFKHVSVHVTVSYCSVTPVVFHFVCYYYGAEYNWIAIYHLLEGSFSLTTSCNRSLSVLRIEHWASY